MLFVDSSFFVSFAIDTDTNHARTTKIHLENLHALHTSEDIIKETLTVISQRKGKQFCREFFQDISPILTILPITTARYAAGLTRFLDPATPKDISLIDCITAVLCHEMGTKRILSFDRHFQRLGLTVVPSASPLKTAHS